MENRHSLAYEILLACATSDAICFNSILSFVSIAFTFGHDTATLHHRHRHRPASQPASQPVADVDDQENYVYSFAPSRRRHIAIEKKMNGMNSNPFENWHRKNERKLRQPQRCHGRLSLYSSHLITLFLPRQRQLLFSTVWSYSRSMEIVLTQLYEMNSSTDPPTVQLFCDHANCVHTTRKIVPHAGDNRFVPLRVYECAHHEFATQPCAYVCVCV